MKLHLAQKSNQNLITGYGSDHVLINKVRYDSPLVIFPEMLLLDEWKDKRFETLEQADFKTFLEMNLEILIIGTGKKQKFVHPRLTSILFQNKIGVECMDTQAACRTYNILMAEDRQVALALFFD